MEPHHPARVVGLHHGQVVQDAPEVAILHLTPETEGDNFLVQPSSGTSLAAEISCFILFLGIWKTLYKRNINFYIFFENIPRLYTFT